MKWFFYIFFLVIAVSLFSFSFAVPNNKQHPVGTQHISLPTEIPQESTKVIVKSTPVSSKTALEKDINLIEKRKKKITIQQEDIKNRVQKLLKRHENCSIRAKKRIRKSN